MVPLSVRNWSGGIICWATSLNMDLPCGRSVLAGGIQPPILMAATQTNICADISVRGVQSPRLPQGRTRPSNELPTGSHPAGHWQQQWAESQECWVLHLHSTLELTKSISCRPKAKLSPGSVLMGIGDLCPCTTGVHLPWHCSQPSLLSRKVLVFCTHWAGNKSGRGSVRERSEPGLKMICCQAAPLGWGQPGH